MKALFVALLMGSLLWVAPNASGKDRHKRHHRNHDGRHCTADYCHGHHHTYYRYRDYDYYRPRRETVISVPGVGSAYIRR